MHLQVKSKFAASVLTPVAHSQLLLEVHQGVIVPPVATGHLHKKTEALLLLGRSLSGSMCLTLQGRMASPSLSGSQLSAVKQAV